MERIQNGTLRPGDKLPPERQLMDMLGVGRSSVREALKALAAMDVVESRSGEGTFVKDLKPYLALEIELEGISRNLQRSDRLNLMQARTVVEKGIIELAIASASDEELARLQTALEDWLKHCSESDIHWPRHDRVHLTIAEMTGNPLLVRVLQMLLETLPGEVRAHGLVPEGEPRDEGALQEELNLHVSLVEAIVARDTKKALGLFEKHQAMERRLISIYYGV
jgi:GntR family transcriptional repressor for pyruvate dehydrogenase complex